MVGRTIDRVYIDEHQNESKAANLSKYPEQTIPQTPLGVEKLA
jgi:hypothetical protein